MDNLFEFIIPIVIAAFYLFGNKLSKKAEEVFDQTSEDTDVDDRQRRIQEEIRRKIMQRTGKPSQSERPQKSQPASSSSSTDLDTKVSEPQAEPELFTSARDTFASQLQARLKRVEATKKQAQELQKRGASNAVPTRRADSRPRSSGLSSGLFSDSVRSTLRDPAAARVAFIYAEVLGTPVSQKKVSTVPGLS